MSQAKFGTCKPLMSRLCISYDNSLQPSLNHEKKNSCLESHNQLNLRINSNPCYQNTMTFITKWQRATSPFF